MLLCYYPFRKICIYRSELNKKNTGEKILRSKAEVKSITLFTTSVQRWKQNGGRKEMGGGRTYVRTYVDKYEDSHSNLP